MNPYLFITLVLLETAHVVSPFVLAGANSGFRSALKEHWRAYLVKPVTLFAAILLAGSTFLTIPALISLYLLINTWHFAMQNFGILQLHFSKWRRINFLLAFLGTSIAMTFAPLVVQVHHWVSDIGLSRRASGDGQWAYLLAILALTPIALLWNKTPWVTFGWQPPGFVLEMAKTLMAARFALSFAHFALSAQIWRFRDPLVRSTIGHTLLTPRRTQACLVH